MTATQKIKILKAMRKFIESGKVRGFCLAKYKVTRSKLWLIDFELRPPKQFWKDMGCITRWWFNPSSIPPRLRAIDKAIKKLEKK